MNLFLDEKLNELIDMKRCAILYLHHNHKINSNFKSTVSSCKNDKT